MPQESKTKDHLVIKRINIHIPLGDSKINNNVFDCKTPQNRAERPHKTVLKDKWMNEWMKHWNLKISVLAKKLGKIVFIIVKKCAKSDMELLIHKRKRTSKVYIRGKVIENDGAMELREIGKLGNCSVNKRTSVKDRNTWDTYILLCRKLSEANLNIARFAWIAAGEIKWC